MEAKIELFKDIWYDMFNYIDMEYTDPQIEARINNWDGDVAKAVEYAADEALANEAFAQE